MEEEGRGYFCRKYYNVVIYHDKKMRSLGKELATEGYDFRIYSLQSGNCLLVTTSQFVYNCIRLYTLYIQIILFKLN